MPAIGVIGRGYLAPDRVHHGRVHRINLSRGEVEVKFFDFDMYGTVSVGRNVGVQGGYRSVVVDYMVDEDTGDLKMKGLYFGAAWSRF